MSALTEFLAEHHYALQTSEGTLTGSGAEFLAREGRSARFFLLGEDHGIGSNLQFATALFNLLQPSGYNAYVTEIGPVSAQHMSTLLEQPDSLAALSEFFTQHPFSIPFSWYEEEVRLLQALQRSPAKAEPAIIGVDQEFILSPQFHLETLQAICTDPAFKTKITEWLHAEKAAIRDMYAGKPIDQLSLFMNLALPAEWSSLRNHFEVQHDPAALHIMEALAASHEIYMYYKTEAYYLNNHVRSLLMKKYFYQAYQQQQAAQPETKYLIKLGANHIERGHSAMGIQDIGNFISELAVMENSQSFHLFVLPVSGKQNAWLPFLPEAFKAMPIEANTQPELRPILENVQEKSGWHLYDLRPLRLRQNYWADGNADFKKFFRGYDAIMLMHAVDPATLIS